MGFTEDELRALLDKFDQMVRECATGQVSFRDFMDQYGAFYLEFALDGHESEPEELHLLNQFAERIELHREIVETVIYRLTSDELLGHPDARKHGFIGSHEGLDRVKSLAYKYLNITRPC